MALLISFHLFKNKICISLNLLLKIDKTPHGALANFSDEFIEEFLTSKNVTFEEYCSYAKDWKVEWLRTELIGNDYNKNVWRLKIITNEGKGEHNGAGAVQDLYKINGKWKIVFWGDYPKS